MLPTELRTETFKIEYPKTAAEKKRWMKEYGFNAYWAGKFWAKRKTDAQFWHFLTMSEMNRQQIPNAPFDTPVIITFFWNDRLDCTNHAAMAKMIEDAMKGRIIHDDSRRYVKGVCSFFHDEEYILVVVKEVGRDAGEARRNLLGH